jgi:hypothetical protein
MKKSKSTEAPTRIRERILYRFSERAIEKRQAGFWKWISTRQFPNIKSSCRYQFECTPASGLHHVKAIAAMRSFKPQ